MEKQFFWNLTPDIADDTIARLRMQERNWEGDTVSKPGLLVVSAHAADYVWRCGGVIAKYLKAGHPVKIIILSYGIRGESNDLWKQENQTAERVKEIRRSETLAAAKALGADDVECWDIIDYPLRIDEELETRMVEAIRRFRPAAIVTHGRFDVLNPDHNATFDFVFRCSVMSNSQGVRTEGMSATKQMQFFQFEPHQTELSGFVPQCFIDITDVYEQKVCAMRCFAAQSHLIEYYTQRAGMRGNHARRTSGDMACRYAESFGTIYPYYGSVFW